MFGKLGVELHAIPGEHDASLDRGGVFQDVFGPTHWALEHKGVYLIGLDNASDPKGGLGDEQLAWFDAEVAKVPAKAQLIVFCHRPLFPLAQSLGLVHRRRRQGARDPREASRHDGVLRPHPPGEPREDRRHDRTSRRARSCFRCRRRCRCRRRSRCRGIADALDHGLGYRGIVVEHGAPVWVDRALVG